MLLFKLKKSVYFIMIYQIALLRDDIYEVTFRGQKVEKSLDFLKEKLSSHKYAELLLHQRISVRDTWGEITQSKVGEVVKLKSDAQRPQPREKMRLPNGYSVRVSKHTDLYELWQWREKGGVRFVAYFFNLESIDTLIDEDKSWLRYNKQLQKNLIEAELGLPKEPLEEI